MSYSAAQVALWFAIVNALLNPPDAPMPTCSACGYDIDPDWCWCGVDRDNHGTGERRACGCGGEMGHSAPYSAPCAETTGYPSRKVIVVPGASYRDPPRWEEATHLSTPTSNGPVCRWPGYYTCTTFGAEAPITCLDCVAVAPFVLTNLERKELTEVRHALDAYVMAQVRAIIRRQPLPRPPWWERLWVHVRRMMFRGR